MTEISYNSFGFATKIPRLSKGYILLITGAVFALVHSPFLQNGIIKENLKSKTGKFLEQTKKIREIEKDLYIGDIITGGCTLEMSQLEVISVSTFQDLGLQLHNYNASRVQLEDTSVVLHVYKLRCY